MEQLYWIGLHKNKIDETLKNKDLTDLIVYIVKIAKEHLLSEQKTIDKQKGYFLYQLATKIKKQSHKFLPIIIKQIIKEGIRNDAQFNAALEYLLEHSTENLIDFPDFEAKCGINVIVTIEEIEDSVAEIITKYKSDLLSERYEFNVGKIITDVRKLLPWADGALVKQEIDLRILLLLGPKTENDLNKKKTKKKCSKIPIKSEICNKKNDSENDSIEELLLNSSQIHKVGENYKTDGYVITENTMKLLEKHVKAVDGKVLTRFPPEPNGVLHIGHAKAININFGLAKAFGGKCILRYDDTNPEKEEEKFFNAIIEMVEWLGYKPYKITYSSDYFDQLYEYAIQLILKNAAYVCHQQIDEIRGFNVEPSPYCNRPIEESLKLFEQMKNGVFNEGEATLRLKLTLEEGKVDPVAYRIKYLPHHRTKDKWCIYPTYDFTHCLCDSIENITHSLCTKEFQSRRSSYYYLCNILDIYCPVQWEYSRLCIDNAVLSKRKILKLIESGLVNDWDDPRLFTLTGLRRRGVPPEAINKFVAKLGLTVAQTTISSTLMDSVIRDYLNLHAPRTMAVLEPLKVEIINFNQLDLNDNQLIDVPLFPSDNLNNKSNEFYSIAIDKFIYIEKTDFQEEGENGFRRLTKSQVVGLKHIGLILQFVSAKKNLNDEIVEIKVTAFKTTNENVTKPLAFIHWVAKPIKTVVRTYTQPQNNLKANSNEDDCIASLKIYKDALIDKCLLNKKESVTRYQFERIGFFSIDFKDSTNEMLYFNQIVPLKDVTKKG